MRPYSIHPTYSDASGLHHNTLEDPNIILKYLEQVNILSDLYIKTGITDIQELGKLINLKEQDIEKINQIKDTYEKCLVRK